MGGCSGQTKQACEVLGKASSLEPGSRAANGAGVLLRTPAPLPCLPGRGGARPQTRGAPSGHDAPRSHTSTAPAGLHLTSLCRDARAARGGRELRPFSPNVRGNLGFGEKQSMQRLIPSDAGPGKPVLKKPVAFSVLKLRTGSRFCFSSSVLGVQLATKATERGAQVHSWRGTGLCYL